MYDFVKNVQQMKTCFYEMCRIEKYEIHIIYIFHINYAKHNTNHGAPLNKTDKYFLEIKPSNTVVGCLIQYVILFNFLTYLL